MIVFQDFAAKNFQAKSKKKKKRKNLKKIV
jgi:hypothetical protein